MIGFHLAGRDVNAVHLNRATGPKRIGQGVGVRNFDRFIALDHIEMRDVDDAVGGLRGFFSNWSLADETDHAQTLMDERSRFAIGGAQILHGHRFESARLQRRKNQKAQRAHDERASGDIFDLHGDL